MVDVKYVRPLKRLISLPELKAIALTKGSPLEQFALVKRGRLSVIPVKEDEWNYILELEKEVKQEK